MDRPRTAAAGVRELMDGKALLGPWAAGLGVAVTDSQWALLAAFLRDLAAFNAKTNLTADEGEDVWWKRHVADGLAAVPTLRRLAGDAPRLLDLGSGGGFIGLTLKIAWPEADVTLMDTARRKFEFLNWAAARTGLRGLHVLWQRAGQKPAVRPFDLVVSRALAAPPEAARLCLGMARTDGGLAAVYQTPAPNVADPGLVEVLTATTLKETLSYRLPDEAEPRHLVVFEQRRPA